MIQESRSESCYVAFGFQRPPAKVIEKTNNTNIRIDLERNSGICILS